MLRTALSALVLSAVCSAVPPALAETIRIEPISVAPKLEEKFSEDYGVREREILLRETQRQLSRSLERAGHTLTNGPSDYVLAITFEDAKPNKPTFEQLGDQPGLDYSASISLGGAKFTATLTPTSGGAARTFVSEFYENDIRDVRAVDTWGDARRGMRRLANDVVAGLPPAPAPAS